MEILDNYTGQIIAEYEMKPGIMVFCVLDVLKTVKTENKLVVTVGVRESGDTFLPRGSKVLLKRYKTEGDLASTRPSKGLLAKVVDIKKQSGVKVHYIDIVGEEELEYVRASVRVNLDAKCHRGDKVFFRTSNISTGGAQFIYDSILTAAVLNQISPVNIVMNGQEQLFLCETKYITYNWWDRAHKVGVQFIDLEESQAALLDQVIQPLLPVVNESDPTPVKESQDDALMEETLPKEEEDKGPKKTMIDPESGRIRFDN